MADTASDPELLGTAYDALARVVGELGEHEAWTPTGCLGWAVRDLVLHPRADCVRALVAVHTPAGLPPDTDAVSYWGGWGSDPAEDETARRATRVEAGSYSWAALRDRYLEAAAAAVRAVEAADPARAVLVVRRAGRPRGDRTCCADRSGTAGPRRRGGPGLHLSGRSLAGLGRRVPVGRDAVPAAEQHDDPEEQERPEGQHQRQHLLAGVQRTEVERDHPVILPPASPRQSMCG